MNEETMMTATPTNPTGQPLKPWQSRLNERYDAEYAAAARRNASRKKRRDRMFALLTVLFTVLLFGSMYIGIRMGHVHG